jgi:hypothetical protein
VGRDLRDVLEQGFANIFGAANFNYKLFRVLAVLNRRSNQLR